MGLLAGTCRIGFVLSIAIEPDGVLFSLFHTCSNSLITNSARALTRFYPHMRHIQYDILMLSYSSI